MSDQNCPKCGAALLTGTTPDGWTWAGCPVAGGNHYSTSSREVLAVHPDADERDDMDELVAAIFDAGWTVSIGANGALDFHGTADFPTDLLDRVERNAAPLVQHLAALPWSLGYKPDELAEREAARRARPAFDALARWETATGATAAWLDSLQTVRLENGRTLGDGRNGGIRRAISRMLADRDSHREAARMLAEALEIAPPATNARTPGQRPALNVVRHPDAPGSPVDVARRWREDGTLDALPERLAVDSLTEWSTPGQAIRHSLAILDRGGDLNEIENARDHLFGIVPSVARWLANREQQRGEAA